MGDVNQRVYLQTQVPSVDGPVLEVGSKEYGSTSSFRTLYQGSEYVGLDMADGTGVDVVADLTQGIGPLREGHFALVICCSVLEHVTRPWVFAENLTRVVRPGGKLFMSVPWVWRYHPYPDDYFRFSHKGVMQLFDRFAWDKMYYTTTAENEFFAIDDSANGADNQMSLLGTSPTGKVRKHLPYLMVNMLGTKR
jgi:SAM-dependent methyltransferase